MFVIQGNTPETGYGRGDSGSVVFANPHTGYAAADSLPALSQSGPSKAIFS